MIAVTGNGYSPYLYIGQGINTPLTQALKDPSGLREKYADDKGIIQVLDRLELAIEKSEKIGKPIDLSQANLKDLSRVRKKDGSYYNLERLILRLSNGGISQYPLEGANLIRADLKGANLYGANLKGANLYGANLERANLYGANLEGAHLEGAYVYKDGKKITGEELKRYLVTEFNVRVDEYTRF